MRVRLAVLALVILAGCNDATSVSEPRRFSVTPAQQWAGGQVTVAGFRASDDLPVLLAGRDTLVLTRLDDSTLQVTLPTTLSGPSTILRARGERLDSIGTIRVYGYLGHDLLTGVNMAGELTVFQHAGFQWILGQRWGNGGQGGVVALDVASGTATAVPSASVPSDGYGAGILSNQQDRFVLADSNGVMGWWSLFPAPAMTHPLPLTTLRHFVLLTDTIFLKSTSQTLVTYRGTTPITTYFASGSSQFRISYDGVLVTAAVRASTTRAPVFNALTGTVAYTLPSLRVVDAIEFSPDASRIAAIGNISGNEKYLFLIDAGTGVTIDSTAVGSWGPGYLKFDPDHPRIYAHSGCTNHPILEVYNTETLVREGRLEAPGTVPCFIDASLSYDHFGGRLYVVVGGVPAERYSFAVLP